MKTRIPIYCVTVIVALIFAACSNNPTPEKLPLSIKNNLNLLPEKPQFVMYVNFKYLRTTEFWKQNIADSMLTSENTFGSLLNVFKTATGATISDGLDEIFFANSWTGENAIVMKGSFDKAKMTGYLSNDSLFEKVEGANSFSYYKHKPSNISFFLKDNFTLCASNYSEQLTKMKDISDTSITGLVKNDELMKAINAIMYKESLWLVSSERMFIRGIFANFIDMKSGKGFDKKGTDTSTAHQTNDSLTKSDDFILNRLYEKVNSISLNGKIKNEVDLVLQFECADRESTLYVDKLFNGIIGLAKISSASRKDDKDTAFEKILNDINLQNFENTFLITIKINSENIQDFRNSNLLINK
ncbi:MAG: hypothetical protein WC139_06640 [Candidatus Kapaibacterium sp.]